MIIIDYDKIIIMKTLIVATFAALMFFAFEMATPKSSEAGITCNTDFWGNYVCRDSYGNSSSTNTDFWGNDVTNFSSGGSMSCSYDFWGNFVCN